VARQVGINVPVTKVAMFVVSSVFMTLVGAVMAPRFDYIDPNFAFNPLISFQVVIMAFLGGMQRLWGPVLAATRDVRAAMASATRILRRSKNKPRGLIRSTIRNSA
jgi:ABC-type branched-subunit amino acid transport system permease subunit